MLPSTETEDSCAQDHLPADSQATTELEALRRLAIDAAAAGVCSVKRLARGYLGSWVIFTPSLGWHARRLMLFPLLQDPEVLYAFLEDGFAAWL